jgi:hypothetical protein
MVLSLIKEEYIDGLSLRLFSVGTSVDDFVLKEAKTHLKSLKEKEKYSGKDVSIVISDERIDEEELKSKIIKILGNPDKLFEGRFEDTLNAGGVHFLNEDSSKRVILLRYDNWLSTSPSYFGPMILHELLHDRRHDVYAKFKVYFSSSFQAIREINPLLFEGLAKRIANPLTSALQTSSEICVNIDTIKFSSLEYTLPLLEIGSLYLLSTYETARRDPFHRMLKMFNVFDVDLPKIISLVDEVALLHLFLQYSIPAKRFGYVSKKIEKYIQMGIRESVRKHRQAAEKIYENLASEKYNETVVKKVVKNSCNFLEKLFKEHGIGCVIDKVDLELEIF